MKREAFGQMTQDILKQMPKKAQSKQWARETTVINDSHHDEEQETMTKPRYVLNFQLISMIIKYLVTMFSNRSLPQVTRFPSEYFKCVGICYK